MKQYQNEVHSVVFLQIEKILFKVLYLSKRCFYHRDGTSGSVFLPIQVKASTY